MTPSDTIVSRKEDLSKACVTCPHPRNTRLDLIAADKHTPVLRSLWMLKWYFCMCDSSDFSAESTFPPLQVCTTEVCLGSVGGKSNFNLVDSEYGFVFISNFIEIKSISCKERQGKLRQ